ncbi:hypothetical protein SAMD00019534_025890, partial [Acytostelium subglobosum LB1]|uniref:hypothetical protein n=1 Tax=Acytostelium subglobosum LB1 TaxID=1410327 RepID=UPI00064486E6
MEVDNKHVNTDEQMVDKCPQHNKKLKFLCTNDRTLICSDCVTTEHFAHKFVNAASLLNKATPIVAEHRDRLHALWRMLKDLGEVHESLVDNESRVQQVFHELHAMLTIEEHKLKKPFVSKRQEAESTIENIIKEVNSILVLIGGVNNPANNQEAAAQQHGLQQVSVTAMAPLIASIKSSGTIEAFVTANQSPIQEDVVVGDQDNLLGQFRHHLVSFNNVSYSLPDFLSIKFQSDRLKSDITKTINLGFDMTTDRTLRAEPLKPQSSLLYMLNALGQLSTFHTGTATWTQHTAKDIEMRSQTSSSLIRVGDYIYVFGDSGLTKTYSRYSLNNKIYDDHAEVTTGDGGNSAAVCYDGSNYIYLVGGRSPAADIVGGGGGGYLKRIDRLNVHTKVFDRIGSIEELGTGTPTCTFLFNDLLYIVCTGRILTYDMFNRQCVDITPQFHLDTIHLSSRVCYDGLGHIYLLDNLKVFIKLSLNTKRFTCLAQLPLLDKVVWKTHSVAIINDALYLYTPATNTVMRYNIAQDTWTTLMDNSRQPLNIFGGVGAAGGAVPIAAPAQPAPAKPPAVFVFGNNNNNNNQVLPQVVNPPLPLPPQLQAQRR